MVFFVYIRTVRLDVVFKRLAEISVQSNINVIEYQKLILTMSSRMANGFG